MAVTIFKFWARDGEERVIEFDAVELEAPTLESQITEYPIESGANLVDHIRLRPLQLRITAVVTNNPARDSIRYSPSMDGLLPARRKDFEFREAWASGASNPNSMWAYQPPNSVAGYGITRRVKYNMPGIWYTKADSIQRVQNIYGDLQRAIAEAREFTVVSETLGEFNQMLVRSVRTERDARAGNSLRLQIEMQQLHYATLLRREVSGRIPKPANKRSKPTVKIGKITVKNADAETAKAAEKNRSSFRSLFDAFDEEHGVSAGTPLDSSGMGGAP